MSTDRMILERMARHGLVGKGAHVPTASVFASLDWKLAGVRAQGVPHTLYQLLNHMVFWQDWVVSWLDGKTPPTPRHASEGWPGSMAPASQAEWQRAVRRFRSGLTRLDRQSQQVDLLSRRREKSPIEMLQTIGAHNSYHAGQVVLIREMLGKWPPPSGGLTW